MTMLEPKREVQRSLFYVFSSEDNLLRSIDRFVGLSGIRQHLAAFYSNTGRPSIDPADAPQAVNEYRDVPDDATFGAAAEVVP